MRVRSAYTAVLLPLPPVGVGVVGMIAAALGSGVRAVRLHRVGASALAVADGVLWGALAASFTVVVWAVGYFVAGQVFRVKVRGRRQAALAVLASGASGWAAVALGAWGGAVVAGVPRDSAAGELADSWMLGGPVLATAIVCGFALARAARGAQGPPP